MPSKFRCFALGVWLYVRTTEPRDLSGKWGLRGLVYFLLAIYAANIFGGPPPSIEAIAWAGQLQWLLVLWGYWVDTIGVSDCRRICSVMGSNTGKITLRSATPLDLTLLHRWDEQPHVRASNPNDVWNWEEELGCTPEWREQLIAESDGRPIGFVQIIDPAHEESRYWGPVPEGLRAIDIWIGEEADLGHGYGTTIMKLALARCFADASVSAVLIDPLGSNTRARRFYERLGFQFVERRRFGQDDCAVYRLTRERYASTPDRDAPCHTR